MRFKLLICDMDNTLYDWVSYFVPSFYAMVDATVDLLGCDRDRLLDDFREVHQRHHDSEQPFALLETRTVSDFFKGLEKNEIVEALNPSFHAFNSARKLHLKLHPGVELTLKDLCQHDIKLVAHTDSQLYGVADRLIRLNLTHYFSSIYCRERPKADHPNHEVGDTWLNNFPMKKVHEISKDRLKPDPTVLAEICKTEAVEHHETAYVGDSIARDILMAKRCGVFSIWAKYGAILNTDNYEKLVRITHWTKEDIDNERQLKKEAESVQPDFTAKDSFKEILPIILNMK